MDSPHQVVRAVFVLEVEDGCAMGRLRVEEDAMSPALLKRKQDDRTQSTRNHSQHQNLCIVALGYILVEAVSPLARRPTLALGLGA